MALKETQFNYSPRQQRDNVDVFAPTPEEEILANREILAKNRLHGEFNVHIVEFKDDGKGIFKPWEEIQRSEGYSNERAAYLVDRFLGFDLVPPTVIRKINGETGSVQQFIPDALDYYCIAFDSKINQIWQNPAVREQLIKMFIFDHIIFNADRHGGNFLISDDNKKIHAIDNESSFEEATAIYAFPDEDEYSSAPNFYDEPISEELIERFKIILADKNRQQELDKELRKLLPKDDREAFFVRLNRIGKLIVDEGKLSGDEIKNYN